MRLKWNNHATNYKMKTQLEAGLAETSLPKDIIYCRRITDSDIKTELRKIRIVKYLGLDNISIKVYMGERESYG